MKYVIVLTMLLGGSAGATGLDDMRSALTALQGQGSLRGAYEVKETKTDLDAKPAKGPETTIAAALLTEDAHALEIRWERALLKRAAEESSPAKGAKRKDALTQLIGQSSAPRMAQVLNYAPRLLQSLSISQLKSERMDTYQGKPARLIEVVFTPQEVPNENVKIKDNTIVAQFWLGADGVPLAASTVHTIKAKFMVFMSYDKVTREELTFSVVANRLVVLKRESQGKEVGPAMDTEFHNLYTFTPKA